MVLRVFGQLKKFIDEYFEYCSGAEMSSIAMDEVARKALISLIKGPLRGSLERLTAKDNVGLHQLMQVVFLLILTANLFFFLILSLLSRF